MKTQDDIDREVAATLEIGSFQAVEPPHDLQQRIMQRVAKPIVVKSVPIYLRTGFATAAAAIIVAINIATVIHFTQSNSKSETAIAQTDAFEDIHANYFPEDSDY